MMRMNKRGESGQPCFTPLKMLMKEASFLDMLGISTRLDKRPLTIATTHTGKPTLTRTLAIHP